MSKDASSLTDLLGIHGHELNSRPVISHHGAASASHVRAPGKWRGGITQHQDVKAGQMGEGLGWLKW